MSSQKFLLQIDEEGLNSLVGDELVGFHYIESLDGCARWALTFETQKSNSYNRLLKDDEKVFTLRFGTGMNADGPTMSELKHVRILRAEKQMAGNAKVLFNLKGTCGGIALNRHRAKDKHWKERRISQIVDELVGDIQQPILQVNITQTEGKFSLMGCNIPTGRYIQRHLLHLAYAGNNNKGRDWRFWIENGKTVHFGPSNPQSGGAPLRFTNLFRDGWLKLKNPKIIKDTQFETGLRNGKIEVLMYDSDRDRLIRQEVGENRGQFNYAGTGRPRERKNVSETFRINYQEGRQTDLSAANLLRNVGQTMWGQHGRSLYRLVAQLDYEPGIKVNQPAFVDLAGPFGIPDVNTGNWLVHTVKHLYSRGSIKTWVRLEKRWER